MAVSVVVVAYNIRRELPRTLLSLSAAYQQHIAPEDYEIVVVDNGSCPPLDEAMWKGLLGNFRLISPPAAPPSPARAINIGLAEARGDVIGVMIDGARIATPGVLHFARHATDLYDTAVVTVLGWYLGLDFQIYAVSGGYDTAREDALLETIGWPENGYRLFEIATPDESSLGSGLVPIAESNCLFLKRASWDRLGGADECFESPGGGLLNHDIYARALELPGAQPVVLLGEGTFHQLHGGISTNSALEELPKKVDAWVKEYKRLRARAPWKHSQPMRPTFLGTLPPAALARLSRDAIKSPPPARPPLGERFDAGLWAFDLPPRPAHPAVAALTDLAHRELRAGRYECAAAVARLARPHAPDDPELQRVLSIVGPWLDARHGHPCTFVPELRARYHLVRADSFGLLAAHDLAVSEYGHALQFSPNLVEAHNALSLIRWPGQNYYAWLDQLHRALRPRNIIEIGIGNGASLALAREGSRVFAIDPSGKIEYALRAETRVFPHSSDEFFGRNDIADLLDEPIDFALIDGLHLFEQVLRDFINVERYCHNKSVVTIHDTIPLDEPTQSRARDTQFHTGDVWKAVLCLKAYRPDLDIFTVATPPTGLTVITGLDPSSRLLAQHYDEAIERFMAVPYAELAGNEERSLTVVPNDWSVVEGRLRDRGIHIDLPLAAQ